MGEEKARGTARMEQRIKEYLDRMAQEDSAFMAKYSNPAKNIVECCNYICGEVQRMGVCGLDDDDVYGMAVHYYEEDADSLGKISDFGGSVVVNHRVELTEEEKAEARKAALDQYQREAMDELKKRYAKPKPQPQTSSESSQEQLTLF